MLDDKKIRIGTSDERSQIRASGYESGFREPQNLIPGGPKPHGSYGSGSWNDPDPEVGFPKKRDLPEVPGEEGEKKLSDDEEIFDDDAAEDALAPTHKLNGQHEGGLENASLKINKNA